jgi:hypothetical protein
MATGDSTQLSSQTAARYGIRIDENDPALVVAPPSQQALAEASSNLVKGIDTSLKGVEAVVERIQTRAGKYLGAECREQISARRSELQGDALAAGTRARELVEEVQPVNTRAMLIRLISVGASSGLLLFGTGVWVGARCL